MTPVTSAAKMVSQLRRWLTGDDVTADSHHSVGDVSGHCSGSCTCNCATDKLQYRGRSYSDCCTASCRGDCQDVAIRERSYSVNSRHMTLQGSKRLSSRAHQTSSGSTWSPVRQRDVREVLEEDRELCRCWSGSVEPVCCCERCFVYIDERPPLLPPPYSELMLLERCANLAKRLNNAEPSITVNTADVSDQVTTAAEAAVSRTPSLAESCQLAGEQSAVTANESFASSAGHTLTSSTNCLPPSVHASLDGEEGYAKSQQRLRWARRQRLLDDALTSSSSPPPNRTICHVVDCW